MTKLKVGDPVFLRGNNCDRDVTITKVGRTKYTLSNNETIDIAPHRLPDDGSRYLLHQTAWLSLQAIADAGEKVKIADQIYSAFSYGNTRASLDQCRRIAAILAETEEKP